MGIDAPYLDHAYYLARVRMSLVKVANPVAELLQSSSKDVFALRGLCVFSQIVIAVAGTLDNEHRSLRCTLESTPGTAFPRNCGRPPRIKLSVDPKQALCLDIPPPASMLVDGVVCAAVLKAILESILVGELAIASQLDVIFPSVDTG